MPNKPFSEREINQGPDGPENGGDNGGDKDEFEDKVQDDKQNFEKLSKDLVDKQGKPEKDESADKYAADKARVDKYQKEKAEHKEQHDKIRKDVIKEVIKDYDVVQVQPPPGDPLTAVLLQRISALEQTVAQLVHFIPKSMRPDLSKGALSGEPEKRGSKPKPPKR